MLSVQLVINLYQDENNSNFNLPLLNINYEGSIKISTVDGEVLSNTIESYFNRSQEHFMVVK